MKIYLDNHSSTPVDPRVAEAMRPYFSKSFGNPSSVHVCGEYAKQAVEKARQQVASIIKAKSDKIYFTNSATEANNIILQGRYASHRASHGRKTTFIITTNSEHSSVVKTLEYMRQEEEFTLFNPYIRIMDDGNINVDELDHLLSSCLRNRVALVSIIAANNEIGTIHDLRAIGQVCKSHNVLFHTDATQAIGKVDIDVGEMNIFALTMNAHKIYGPKGVGALYIRNEHLIKPLIHGGYQNTFSSGTQNVPAIVGFGKACEILQKEGKEENERIRVRRDLLLRDLSARIPDIFVNGTMRNRLPNNLNVSIKGIQAEILVKGMDDVIISGGSACTSGSLDPSHVILALEAPYPECAIRFGLGRWTTMAECKYAVNRIAEIVESIRSQDNAEED